MRHPVRYDLPIMQNYDPFRHAKYQIYVVSNQQDCYVGTQAMNHGGNIRAFGCGKPRTWLIQQ